MEADHWQSSVPQNRSQLSLMKIMKSRMRGAYLESIRAAYATSVLHIPLGFLTRDGLTMRLRFAEG